MLFKKINCEQAKQIDLVSYLETLNIRPSKVRGNDYWYHSPFHQEKTPSFKINRKLNVWYDHSIGKGGNLIDFGIAYHKCSVAELLEKLNTEENLSPLFSFHQQYNSNVVNVENVQGVNDNGLKNNEAIMKNTDGILKTGVEKCSNHVVKMKNQNDAIMKNSVGTMKNLEDKNKIDYKNSFIMKEEENKRIQTGLNENESVQTKTNDVERGQMKMKVLSITDIKNETLTDYIESRGVSLLNARQYCKEVSIVLNNRQRCMIGFKNQSGGYELRATDDFKSTVAPKDFTFVPNEKQAGINAVVVVEGFFDFLSLLEMREAILPEATNYLVLNSLSFFEKAVPLMEEYQRVYLLLDNDEAGKSFTASALKRSTKYTDLSYKYSDHKDLNEWLVKEKNHLHQTPVEEERQLVERSYRRGFGR